MTSTACTCIGHAPTPQTFHPIVTDPTCPTHAPAVQEAHP